MRLATLCSAALMSVAVAAGAQAQQTRAQLQSQIDQNFSANGVSKITGPNMNSAYSGIISSMGALADLNLWSGLNKFAINPEFDGCVGYPYSTGSGPIICSTTSPPPIAVTFTQITAPTASILSSQCYVLLTGTSSQVITLPRVVDTSCALVIKDASCNASTYNRQILPVGADLIDNGVGLYNDCAALALLPSSIGWIMQ